MKKRTILGILSLILLSFSLNAKNTVQSDLVSDNEFLLKRAKALVNEAQMSLIEERVDSSFANGLIRSLTTVVDEAVLRRVVVKKITDNNNPILDQIQANLDTQHLFCDACKRVLGMIPMFDFKKKAYFAPGKYIIPYNLRPKAEEVYKPLLDSISSITNNYPELKFDALVRTIGYSDATPTPRGSVLYNDMVQRMQYEPLEMEEINQYLSFLRSYDMADLLRSMLKSDVPKNVKIRYSRLGLGTSLPNPNLFYTRNDERRRVVKVYWHILPKF